MGKKEKIPPPGNKKDEYTNFWTKGKWKQNMMKTILEVNSRNIRGPGAQMVANALNKNKIVTQIDLSHNHLGDQGAIELAQMLKVNDCVQTVNISCNEIGDVGGIAIASAFLPQPNPTGQPSQWNRTVTELNLSCNVMKDDSMQALCNAAAFHKDLCRLNLSYNKVGPLGCKYLAKAMKINTTMTVILGHNELGDEGTEVLCGAWKEFGQKGIHAVLNLWSNDICRVGAEAIGNLLVENDFVQEVNLAHNSIADLGAQLLFNKLMAPVKCALRTVYLQENKIGDEGAELIAQYIESCPEALQKINLAHNEITDKGGFALASALQKNPAVTTFMLSYNEIGEQSVRAFADLVRGSKTLKLLDLKKNRFTDEQRTMLSKAMTECEIQGFRFDYGAMDDAVPQQDFLDKLKDVAEAAVKAAQAAAEKQNRKKKG